MIWRITERRAFQSLASTGRRSRTESLWCSYVNDPAVTPVRVAFALGRNIGPATTRNRVRRRLRAILQAGAASVPACGYLLIGARPSVTKHTYEQLAHEVDELLRGVTASRPARSRR